MKQVELGTGSHRITVLVPHAGVVQTFNDEHELAGFYVGQANLLTVLDTLLARAQEFTNFYAAIDRLKVVAEAIVAECVAAKLTEPLSVMPKHDNVKLAGRLWPQVMADQMLQDIANQRLKAATTTVSQCVGFIKSGAL